MSVFWGNLANSTNKGPIQQQASNFDVQQTSDMQQQQTFSSYGSYSNSFRSPSAPAKLIRKVAIESLEYNAVERKSNEVIGLVLTLCSSSSYDMLFQSVPQVSPDGIVEVYALDLRSVETILAKLEGTLQEEIDPLLQTMFDQMNLLEASSVVWNFECCSDCSDLGFPVQSTTILIARLLERGFMVMCSDFSVKALLTSWDSELLGVNPFIRVGEFHSCFSIHFEPSQLRDCPSAQLQKLGDLCADGHASLHALGNTIAFTADVDLAARCDAYKLVIFTVVTSTDQTDSLVNSASKFVQTGSHKGIVGHAMLKYPSGGILMLSCGHWIELSQVNTSEEAVLKVAADMYGDTYSSNWAQELKSVKCAKQKQTMLNAYSAQIIQNSTPAQYSKKC